MSHDRHQWLREVDAYLAGNSWDRMWARMNAHIKACPPHASTTHVSHEPIGEARV